jgi:hypothetical protein
MNETHPSAGPMNGAATYAAIGIALLAGGQTSDIVAGPILNEGEPKTPARKANPDPRMKRPNSGILIWYTRRSPYFSLKGEPIIGPRA